LIDMLILLHLIEIHFFSFIDLFYSLCITFLVDVF